MDLCQKHGCNYLLSMLLYVPSCSATVTSLGIASILRETGVVPQAVPRRREKVKLFCCDGEVIGHCHYPERNRRRSSSSPWRSEQVKPFSCDSDAVGLTTKASSPIISIYIFFVVLFYTVGAPSRSPTPPPGGTSRWWLRGENQWRDLGGGAGQVDQERVAG